MFGISINELFLILLLMVIFLNPKDIPSVVNFLAKIYKKIKDFVFEIKSKVNEITSEIKEEKDDIEENFHDRVEKIKLEFEKTMNTDFDDDKKTPLLIKKKK